MAEIIFTSNLGITFERTVHRNGRCSLLVRGQGNKRKRTFMQYTYNNVPSLQSPYLNWDNLNCCNGWKYDEDYLYIAVQQIKKLYANINFGIHSEDFITQAKLYNPHAELHSEKSVSTLLSEIKANLPNDCIMGIESEKKHEQNLDEKGEYSFFSRSVYICKIGKLSDYYNIDDVISNYGHFGLVITGIEKQRILEISETPLQDFSRNDFAYRYANPIYGSHFVLTGLLLGYPIETTAALIERHALFMDG